MTVDAEGMAILANGDRLVSFERNHRIWLYPRQPDGTYGLPRAVNKPATTCSPTTRAWRP
jgi:hypothetical protein